MIEVRICCDECGEAGDEHESRLQAIDAWQQQGGVISAFSNDALCARCYERIDHPSMRSRHPSVKK
jgi:hypothetical protein